MKRFLVLLLIFVLTGLSMGATSIQPPKGFAGNIYRGTLALYGTFNGRTHFMCTVEPFEKISGGYHLISAGHCVQLSPEGTEFSVADDIGGTLTPVKMLKARLDKDMDFSEFELKTKHKYPVFILGDEHNMHLGDPVINVSFAAGVAKQLSYGAVSSDILKPTTRCPDEDCAGNFLVQVSGAGGASGSAIVSARTHEVIGLLVVSFDDPIGLGIEPISKFKKFLTEPTQPHPAPEDNQ